MGSQALQERRSPTTCSGIHQFNSLAGEAITNNLLWNPAVQQSVLCYACVARGACLTVQNVNNSHTHTRAFPRTAHTHQLSLPSFSVIKADSSGLQKFSQRRGVTPATTTDEEQ
eukprot:592220-Pelagomonas_calceolata.AAC.3